MYSADRQLDSIQCNSSKVMYCSEATPRFSRSTRRSVEFSRWPGWRGVRPFPTVSPFYRVKARPCVSFLEQQSTFYLPPHALASNQQLQVWKKREFRQTSQESVQKRSWLPRDRKWQGLRRAPFFHSRFKSRALQYLEALLRWNQPAELRFAVM